MGRSRNFTKKKRKFHGNRFTNTGVENSNVMEMPDQNKDINNISTASSSKLDVNLKYFEEKKTENKSTLTGNRIFDIENLINVILILCCPQCFTAQLDMKEDSRMGLCSNFTINCKNCNFCVGFSSTKKKNKNNIINTLMVFGLRLIGKGYNSGLKLFSVLNLPFISKEAFHCQKNMLLTVVKETALKCMQKSGIEIRNDSVDVVQCGVSVDGTWQRRGYSSLNGCVSAISVTTGKVLDIEVMSQYCGLCKREDPGENHICTSNHTGTSSNMECVGALRIFERSESLHNLYYTEYYGDGDCKAYEYVKNVYGKDSVTKLECVGHVQKRVGSRLRKLKKKHKGLGGKGKLTDAFIDKLQNYYGIAMRSQHKTVLELQSNLIAALCHVSSNKNNLMHNQCPLGAESWCRYQRYKALGENYVEKNTGIPDNVLKMVKPVYLQLCDKSLLERCLHGLTQNNNESFNNVLWEFLPKVTFVELNTLQLGAYLAVLQFNEGFRGILAVVEALGVEFGSSLLKGFEIMDKERIADAQRHSLPAAKLHRKKLRAIKKKKVCKQEKEEGVCYEGGGF